MTTTTISAAPDIVSVAAATREQYAEFYALANSYQEPARPSSATVLAVRDALASSLDSGRGQHYWESTTLPGGTPWAGKSTVGSIYGRTFRMELSPGTIAVGSKDFDQLGLTEEEAAGAARKAVDMAIVDGQLLDTSGPSTAEIMAWSAKSRANMSRVLASLDYSDWSRDDGALAMVTFTLPGDWKPVAPNGKTFKRYIEVLRRRWARVVGPWTLLWKLEFQRRGAPHFHALMRVPAMVTWTGGYHHKLGYELTTTFEDWLAWNWADIVNASDDVDTLGRWKPVGSMVPVLGFDGLPLRNADGSPVLAPEAWEIVGPFVPSSEKSRHLSAGTGVDFSGKDFSDPRRIAMYFAGHSAKTQDGKEYQHIVPAKWRSAGNGPGRFWGFSGLDKATAVLELTQRDYDRVRRELRKLSRARSWEVAVLRAKGAAVRENQPVPSAFRVRRPMARKSQLGGNGGQNGGWVLLNDALAVARGLGAWLEATADCVPGCGCERTPPAEYADGVLREWSKPVLV